MDDNKITQVNFDSDSNYYYTKYLEQHSINKKLNEENARLQKRVEELEKEYTAMDSELYDLESFIRAMSEDEVETVLKRMADIMRQRYKSFWGRDLGEANETDNDHS